jgi:hypothetical protein
VSSQGRRREAVAEHEHPAADQGEQGERGRPEEDDFLVVHADAFQW